MTLIARAAVAVLLVVLGVNVLAWLLGSAGKAAPTPRTTTLPPPTAAPRVRTEEDLCAALSATWQLLPSPTVSLKLRDCKLVKRAGGPVVLRAVATLQVDREEGSPRAWHVMVVQGTTAIITRDGTWRLVADADGVGVIRAGELLQRSPEHYAGAPRAVSLTFPPLPEGAAGVVLQVTWRLGSGPDRWQWYGAVTRQVPLPTVWR